MRSLQTIVIGETMTLSRHADLSFSWDEVASGRALVGAAEAHKQWTNKAELIRELEDDSDLYPEQESEFVTLRPNSSVSAFSEQEDFESDTDDEGLWDDDSDDEDEESAFEDFSPWSRSVVNESNKVN